MCPVMEMLATVNCVTYSCQLTSMMVDESDDMRYTTYGVAVYGDAGQTVLAFPDISTDRAFVEGFVRMVDSHDIALVHIHDLLEDYLE